MKYTRLIIGIAAILVTLWVIVGEQMTAASANAVVNAPVATLRSPIAGTLELQAHALGARLSQNELLATVTDTRADTTRLADLQLELDTLDAGTNRLQAQIAALSRERDTLLQRSEAFTEARLAELEAELAEARVRRDLLQRGDADASAAPGGEATFDENGRPGTPPPSAIALSYARERVETLQIARVCRKDHPLAGRKMLDWTELGTLKLCLLTPEMQNRRIINRQFMEAGVAPVSAIESNSTVVLVSNVLTGDWVTILPTDLAKFLAEGKPLSLVPLATDSRAHEVGLIAPWQEPYTPVLQALLDEAKALARPG